MAKAAWKIWRRDAYEKIQRTGEDLTTLEINTIIKKTMTGAKSSDMDGYALYQLAGIYAVELVALGEKYQKFLGNYPEKNLPNGTENLFRRKTIFSGGGIFSFREIAIWCNAATNWIGRFANELNNTESERAEDQGQLMRISRISSEVALMLEKYCNDRNRLNSKGDGVRIMNVSFIGEDLKNKEVENRSEQDIWHQAVFDANRLYKRYEAANAMELYRFNEMSKTDFLDTTETLNLDLRDRMMLRKAIDIGVEKIVMQTRIGIDGDITTRISQEFSEKPVQFVLDMHNTSIQMSVNFWEKIFEALVSFFKNILIRKR